MKDYSEWPVLYEDEELDVRQNPERPEEYGVCVKKTENFLFLPRGCPKEIARGDREHGRKCIDNLMPLSFTYGGFFNGTQLTHDSLNCAITKAYMKDEEEIREYLSQTK